MKSTKLLLLTAPLLLGINAQAPPGQQETDPVSEYNRLLDQLLPLKDPLRENREDFQRAPISIAVRVRPSFSSEWGFVLRISEAGVAGVTYLRAQRSIWQVGANPIERTTKSIPDKVAASWVEELWKTLEGTTGWAKEHAGFTQLDGTSYELLVSTNMSNVTFSVSDDEADEHAVTGSSPMARWINQVRLQLPGSPTR